MPPTTKSSETTNHSIEDVTDQYEGQAFLSERAELISFTGREAELST